MKVAVLSESSADEAAVRLIVEGVLGIETERYDPPVRSRGWPAVRNVLPAIIKHLHYQSDADALVVVADSNGSAVHDARHATEVLDLPACRICEMRRVAEQTMRLLRDVPNRPPLKVAIGLAVPAIEAWYAVGVDGRVNEPTWAQALRTKQFPYTKPGLKQLIYETDRPSIRLETERAIEAGRRLAGMLDQMEERFPIGFGALRSDLSAWR